MDAPKTTRWWFVLSQTLGELSQLPPGDPTVATYTALCHLRNVTGHRNWSQDSEARDEPFQHILRAPGQLRFWTMDLGVPNSFSPLLKMSKGSFHIFSLGKNTDSLTLRLCMVWICALPSKSAKLAISRPRRCGELHRLFLGILRRSLAWMDTLMVKTRVSFQISIRPTSLWGMTRWKSDPWRTRSFGRRSCLRSEAYDPMGLSRNGEPRGPDNLPKDRKVGSSNLETWKLWEKQYYPNTILENPGNTFLFLFGATLWVIFHGESEDSPVDLGTISSISWL